MDLMKLIYVCGGIPCNANIIPFLDKSTIIIYVFPLHSYIIFKEQGYYQFLKNAPQPYLFCKSKNILPKEKEVAEILASM